MGDYRIERDDLEAYMERTFAETELSKSIHSAMQLWKRQRQEAPILVLHRSLAEGRSAWQLLAEGRIPVGLVLALQPRVRLWPNASGTMLGDAGVQLTAWAGESHERLTSVNGIGPPANPLIPSRPCAFSSEPTHYLRTNY